MTAPITRKSTVEEIGAIVCQALSDAGIDAVLTGGSVVSIYSESDYVSYDLDFVSSTSLRNIEPVMRRLGFKRGPGRHFSHPVTKYLVEFPAGPLSVGDAPVKRWARRRTRGGTLQMLTPTQCVMDRLAAFYHWNDRQALDQALMVARRQKVDLAAIRRWSAREGHLERFAQFRDLLKSKRVRKSGPVATSRRTR